MLTCSILISSFQLKPYYQCKPSKVPAFEITCTIILSVQDTKKSQGLRCTFRILKVVLLAELRRIQLYIVTLYFKL